MIEILNTIAALCAIRAGDWSLVAVQADCHAYYAECIKKDRTTEALRACMVERAKLYKPGGGKR